MRRVQSSASTPRSARGPAGTGRPPPAPAARPGDDLGGEAGGAAAARERGWDRRWAGTAAVESARPGARAFGPRTRSRLLGALQAAAGHAGRDHLARGA